MKTNYFISYVEKTDSDFIKICDIGNTIISVSESDNLLDDIYLEIGYDKHIVSITKLN